MALLTDETKRDIENNIFQWLNELEQNNEPGAKIVDFDVVWKWGYQHKQHAKRKLLKCVSANDMVSSRSGERSTNQISLIRSGEQTIGGGRGGHNKEQILLTLNAAKQFLLQAPNGKGDLIRQHFIDSEQKWRLLKTNVDSGRIRLEDKVTGEVVDNPMADPEYIDTRYDTAVANAVKNATLQRKFPTLKPDFYREFNGLISESVLGKRPRQFLIENNFLKKRKNRKGNMVYPNHPNSRDVMTKYQLGVVQGLEEVARRAIVNAPTGPEALDKFKDRQKHALLAFADLHGTCLDQPTLLEDVKEAHRTQPQIGN